MFQETPQLRPLLEQPIDAFSHRGIAHFVEKGLAVGVGRQFQRREEDFAFGHDGSLGAAKGRLEKQCDGRPRSLQKIQRFFATSP
jgi:hypothetical protein